MKSLPSVFLLTAMGFVMTNDFQPSSTSSVSLIGGVIRSRHLAEAVEKKYPRDECPVCEGKGWYMSGDGIEKVDCGYCEETKREEVSLEPEEILPEPEENNLDPPLVPITPKQFMLY